MAKRDVPKLPGAQAMKIGMVLFVSWMAYVGYKNEQDAKEGKENAISLTRYEAIQKLTDTDRWAREVYPSYGKSIRYQDVVKGTGDVAACGQKVTVNITAYSEKDKPLESFLMPEKPVTFTVGVDAPNESWGRAVMGMRMGGVRQLSVGARMVYPDAKEPPIESYQFDVELVALEPLATNPAAVFSHSVVQEGVGDGLRCGDEASILLHMWSVKGALLFTTNDREPLTLHLGKSHYGHGLDRGLIGLEPGEIRKLTLPPEYQIQTVEPVSLRLPFPKDEIAIVEVARVPYKDKNKSSPQESKELQNEPERNRKIKSKSSKPDPDSQSSERDPALTDNGRDGKSSGAESSRP
jgi:FKBP-type peptidyl-prolyl cis-trans isomerase